MDGIGARPALIRGTIRCVDSAEFLEGGPYPALYEGLTLALVMVGRAAVRLSVRPLIALGVAAFFAAGFGAVKYSPVIPVMGTFNDSKTGLFAAAAYSMIMLGWTTGRQYSEREPSGMIKEAGFKTVQVKPAFGFYSIVTGVKP